MKVFIIIGFLLRVAQASKETTLECGACLMIAAEVQRAIDGVDPKKKVVVGSFRVDPKGNQKTNEIPYARSEAQLMEALEESCDKYKKYTQAVHRVTGKKTFVHEDLVVEYKRIKGQTGKLLYACNDIVDSHEAEIIDHFRQEKDNSVHQLCHEALNLCSPVDCIAFPDYREDKFDDDEVERNHEL